MSIDSFITAIISFTEPIFPVAECMVKTRFLKVIAEENGRTFAIKSYVLDLIETSVLGKECEKVTKYLSYDTQSVVALGTCFLVVFLTPIISRKLCRSNNQDRLILPATACAVVALATGYFTLNSVVNLQLCLTNDYFHTTLKQSSIEHRTCMLVEEILKRHCSFEEPESDLRGYLKRTGLFQCIVGATTSIFFTGLSFYIVYKYACRNLQQRAEQQLTVRPTNIRERKVGILQRLREKMQPQRASSPVSVSTTSSSGYEEQPW